LNDDDAGVCFSPVSLWEVAIKSRLGRADFDVEPRVLRRGLLDNQWREVAVTSEHAVGVYDLPPIHKDPFDRILLAQAHVEGLTLLTSDAVVAKYPGDVRKV
jgi:PIN domain nuclease of toxin-antitoxin system